MKQKLAQLPAHLSQATAHEVPNIIHELHNQIVTPEAPVVEAEPVEAPHVEPVHHERTASNKEHKVVAHPTVPTETTPVEATVETEAESSADELEIIDEEGNYFSLEDGEGSKAIWAGPDCDVCKPAYKPAYRPTAYKCPTESNCDTCYTPKRSYKSKRPAKPYYPKDCDYCPEPACDYETKPYYPKKKAYYAPPCEYETEPYCAPCEYEAEPYCAPTCDYGYDAGYSGYYAGGAGGAGGAVGGM